MSRTIFGRFVYNMLIGRQCKWKYTQHIKLVIMDNTLISILLNKKLPVACGLQIYYMSGIRMDTDPYHYYYQQQQQQQYYDNYYRVCSFCHLQWDWIKHRKYKLDNTGAIKDGQPRETDNIGYTRRRKTKEKHNTLRVGQHYAQTNTINVNKT